MEYEEHAKRVYAPCLAEVKEAGDGTEPVQVFGEDLTGKKITLFINPCKAATHICIAKAHVDDYPKCIVMYDTRGMHSKTNS